MADTDALRPYRASATPPDPNSQARFVTDELRRVENSIAQLVEVMKKLEARMIAHGI